MLEQQSPPLLYRYMVFQVVPATISMAERHPGLHLRRWGPHPRGEPVVPSTRLDQYGNLVEAPPRSTNDVGHSSPSVAHRSTQRRFIFFGHLLPARLWRIPRMILSAAGPESPTRDLWSCLFNIFATVCRYEDVSRYPPPTVAISSVGPHTLEFNPSSPSRRAKHDLY